MITRHRIVILGKCQVFQSISDDFVASVFHTIFSCAEYDTYARYVICNSPDPAPPKPFLGKLRLSP